MPIIKWSELALPFETLVFFCPAYHAVSISLLCLFDFVSIWNWLWDRTLRTERKNCNANEDTRKIYIKTNGMRRWKKNEPRSVIIWEFRANMAYTWCCSVWCAILIRITKKYPGFFFSSVCIFFLISRTTYLLFPSEFNHLYYAARRISRI